MRRRLIALTCALVGAAALWSVSVAGQATQCGGSFVPNLNCLISGRWYFTSVSTAQGPIPFQVRDQNSLPVDVTGIVSRTVDLTNADVLALHTTPFTVVPAPGAGYYVDVIAVDLAFNYTGAYTSGSNLKLFYGNRTSGPAASASITASGFLTSVSADTITHVAGIPDNTNPPTTNVAVVLMGTTSTAFASGNAADTVRVVVWYRIVKTGL